MLPFLYDFDARAEYFEPEVQDLLVESETDKGTEFYVHLSVGVVVGQIYSLDAAIEELEGFRRAESLKINCRSVENSRVRKCSISSNN